ncbi:hypothetical protein [Rummeliibacillus sp. SL167]|uniref:hypothetical protein n=1 Tax=Rummeliibacillus sp. SL167 TaxID=2579792 RepID=UPI0011B69001|nr:hypothetical protein [Rummeliibacillus sp. SL167]
MIYTLLLDFEVHKKIANRVQTELVGQTAADGILITGYKSYFVDRLIGQVEAGSTHKGKREGVRIEDAKDVLLNPIDIKTKPPNSRQYVGNNCRVSINYVQVTQYKQL